MAAALQYKTFDQFVTDLSNRWGGATGVTPQLLSGDPALAIFQSTATQLVFFEFLLQAVVGMARLSTSTGADVDSFVADFGITRLPATYASGPVTLTALSPPANQVIIPVGTIVQSPGGAYQYQLIADPTQTAYDAVLNAYILQANQTSITATVQALQSGSTQNVQANILTQFGAAIAGVDTVTNPSPIQNGKDAETDSALKTRFVQFFAALSKATMAAILYAMNSVQQGLDINLLENENQNGAAQNGFFTAVAEDGSGTLPSTLQTALYNAINLVRAFTVNFTVVGPTVLNPTVALNIRVAPGYASATVIANVVTAILDYVGTLTIGQTLYLNQLVGVAESVAGVVSVQPASALINRVAQDLVATGFQLIRLLSNDLTVGTY